MKNILGLFVLLIGLLLAGHSTSATGLPDGDYCQTESQAFSFYVESVEASFLFNHNSYDIDSQKLYSNNASPSEEKSYNIYYNLPPDKLRHLYVLSNSKIQKKIPTAFTGTYTYQTSWFSWGLNIS